MCCVCCVCFVYICLVCDVIVLCALHAMCVLRVIDTPCAVCLVCDVIALWALHAMCVLRVTPCAFRVLCICVRYVCYVCTVCCMLCVLCVQNYRSHLSLYKWCVFVSGGGGVGFNSIDTRTFLTKNCLYETDGDRFRTLTPIDDLFLPLSYNPKITITVQ